MRTAKYFTLLLATLLSLTSYAQHCPYDGSNIVIVKLVDAKGNTVNTKNYSAWLQEVDNPLADSCTYATGLLKLPLLDKADFFIDCDERYRSYSKQLQQRLQQKGVLAAASLFVNLNQAKRTCMLNNAAGDFDYRTRKFVVIVTGGKKEIRKHVPAGAIQGLCTNNPLNDFEAVVIKVP